MRVAAQVLAADFIDGAAIPTLALIEQAALAADFQRHIGPGDHLQGGFNTPARKLFQLQSQPVILYEAVSGPYGALVERTDVFRALVRNITETPGRTRALL